MCECVELASRHEDTEWFVYIYWVQWFRHFQVPDFRLTKLLLVHIHPQFHGERPPYTMEPPPLNNHFIIPLPDLEADSNTPQLPLVEVTDVWQTPVESLLFHSFGDTQPKAVGTISKS